MATQLAALKLPHICLAVCRRDKVGTWLADTCFLCEIELFHPNDNGPELVNPGLIGWFPMHALLTSRAAHREGPCLHHQCVFLEDTNSSPIDMWNLLLLRWLLVGAATPQTEPPMEFTWSFACGVNCNSGTILCT
eukprot:5543041-Amphidinium_carterae.1